jgi:uncharacterized membrane protein
MKRLLMIAGLAALSPAPLLAQSGPYRAVGTEPFWSVTIADGRIVYDDAERRRVSVRAPAARPSFNGRRYVTRRLVVDITRQRCSDGMSDRIYPDTVRLTVDGRDLSGCGGAPLAAGPPASLAGTSWRMLSIDGADVSRQDGYVIAFQSDRLNARPGCNSISGGYRVAREGFQAGPLAMTRMACPGPRMQHEQAAARLLRGRLRLYYPDAETLVMRGESGEIRLQRRR